MTPIKIKYDRIITEMQEHVSENVNPKIVDKMLSFYFDVAGIVRDQIYVMVTIEINNHLDYTEIKFLDHYDAY